MRSYETGDAAVTYSIDVSYADAAASLFETEEEHEVYDRKLDHLEQRIQELGDSPRDTFFGHYQEARRSAESDLPRFDTTIVSGEDERTGTSARMLFRDESGDGDTDAFVEAVEEALTETLADTVATWYDATRPASPYRDEDLSLALERRDDGPDTTFMIDTAPGDEGAVMERAMERMDTDLDRYKETLTEPRHRIGE
ncbi:MAG: hypothetical protein SVU32_08545 [Candidatus Nanohaloarchaea archaeon]|nr:hypothetical protein [Candidatus Nanohaloarchaea archaeon]